jgi:hypothetical protein
MTARIFIAKNRSNVGLSGHHKRHVEYRLTP